MIRHVHSENFILDSTIIFMKAFHLLIIFEVSQKKKNYRQQKKRKKNPLTMSPNHLV